MVSQQPSTRCKPKTGNFTAMADTPSKELADSLFAVASSRDKKAFAYLFSYFSPKIKRFGIKQFNSEAQAMELVQETLTSVWRKAHLYNNDKGAATTWVYTVMRNASFDMLRKMKSTKEDCISEDIWPLIEQSETENYEFSDHLEDKQIKNYLEKLPQAQRDVVRGVYFQDMSQEQLADQLGIPVGTVKSRLRLALQKLRNEMGESHD
ncbi:MAG: sigma-70 family RNA polymerase sigma factor [Pseudoalteromonas sp.]|uniref:sigma-70 family RNA polymerase sigma factor n=1 Tax=unclassified Pseudoalteromonas TaxID=194690 RepID=UPI000C07497C|nr:MULTISPECIES: sigma-70 family RNA polymerase sigma factor [unclassified Pseudoalteromonas]MDP2633159.1 sigma-70 family RNA polymerase sigma factor [Pseudoalteromonas sp. 1_MG-2023]PHN91862.1 RNA polymerase subunit sigma [Pseudoalteromonas sp. 3D05]TGE84943.1 RNA polymerase subunit sigma [Pseudoalteromonas sp. KS88]